MPTALINNTSGTGVGVTNTGSLAFDINTATITDGGPQFALGPSQPTLPLTVNPGDPATFFPIVFAPDDLGVFNGILHFSTDLLAPQDEVDQPLTGLSIPFFPVSILDNDDRMIMFTFDSNELLFMLIDNFNYEDDDSIIEFNGSLWQQVGQEKTIERLLVYYENIGVCSGLRFDIICLRPSISPDTYDTVTKNISIGTVDATGEDRSAYVDIVASGEILFLRMTRVRDTGPCSILAITPFFADRGEKVENV
jgi:hypothetical protein